MRDILKKHKGRVGVRASRLPILFYLFAALSLWVFFPCAASADTVINLNDLPQFNRSQGEIAARYAELKAISSSYDRNSYFEPGNRPVAIPANAVKGGRLSQSALADFLKHLNYFRYLAGVPSIVGITGDDIYQAACVLMIRAGNLEHDIASVVNSSANVDVPQDFKNLAIMANNNHNIISQRDEDSTSEALSFGDHFFSCLFGYVGEGAREGTIGHRYALLTPRAKTYRFAYAYQSDYQAGYYITKHRTMGGILEQYTPEELAGQCISCFPNPGNCPLDGAFRPENTYWSVNLEGTPYSFGDINAVTISFQEGDNQPQNLQAYLYNGSLPIFWFKPVLSSAYAQNPCKVVISGLRDASGAPLTVQYTVQFFAVASPSDYTAPVVSSGASTANGGGVSGVPMALKGFFAAGSRNSSFSQGTSPSRLGEGLSSVMKLGRR